MKLRSVPGGDARFTVSVIDLWVIPGTVYCVGVADLVMTRRFVIGLRGFR
jgi:hypothetical protein